MSAYPSSYTSIITKQTKNWREQPIKFVEEEDYFSSCYLDYLYLFGQGSLLFSLQKSTTYVSLSGSYNVTLNAINFLSNLKLKGINIPRLNEVQTYLVYYPDMINIIHSVCLKLLEQFNINTRFFLEVYHDPEIEDEYLTIYVRQNTYDDDIIEKIDNIMSDFEDNLSWKSGWLIVTTDFQPIL